MIFGKDYVNHDVRKQQGMFTGQESLHHLSGGRHAVARAVPARPEAGARRPAITERCLSGRARPALRAHPRQGVTPSTSLNSVEGHGNTLAMRTVRRVMCSCDTWNSIVV